MIIDFRTRTFIIPCFLFYISSVLFAIANMQEFGNRGEQSDSPRSNEEAPRFDETMQAGPPEHQPTRSPNLVNQGIQGPPSDFLCFDDKNAMVVRDVPCPAEPLLKVEVTPQMLDFFLKNTGGGTLAPAVSPVAPAHLTDFDLSDIASADWMNYNRSDLTIRLQKLLQQLQDNKVQLHDQLLKYLSSDSLRNITTLTNLLLDVLNSSEKFNVCTTFNNKDPLINEFDCEDLEAEIMALNYLNIHLQEYLASENNSADSIHVNVTDSAESNFLTGNITDGFIDALIQKLGRMKEDSKLLGELNDNLLNAVNDFKDVVEKIIGKFFTSLFGVDYPSFSDKIFSAMLDFKLESDGSIHEQKFELQMSSQTTAVITEPTAHGVVANEFDGKVTDNELVFPTVLPVSSAGDFSLSEIQHEASQSDHKMETSTSTANTDDHIIDDAVQYFEGILKIAIALISSLTELGKVLKEVKISEFEPDEVLKNMTAWHSLRSRTRRDTTGFIIAADRCQRQGSNVDQTKFISLCSVCIHTTVLDDTFYPRFLTEKICSPGSSANPAYRDGCLFQHGPYGSIPGGSCRQQEFHILILHRVPGKCMKVVSQGQEIITDQWQSTTHALRIGCECMVDQGSQFAQYVNGS